MCPIKWCESLSTAWSWETALADADSVETLLSEQAAELPPELLGAMQQLIKTTKTLSGRLARVDDGTSLSDPSTLKPAVPQEESPKPPEPKTAQPKAAGLKAAELKAPAKPVTPPTVTRRRTPCRRSRRKRRRRRRAVSSLALPWQFESDDLSTAEQPRWRAGAVHGAHARPVVRRNRNCPRGATLSATNRRAGCRRQAAGRRSAVVPTA